jgi:phosphate-selective porin OprO and OprP
MKRITGKAFIAVFLSSAAGLLSVPAVHAATPDGGAATPNAAAIQLQLDQLQNEISDLKQQQHEMVHKQAVADHNTWRLVGSNKSVMPRFVSPDGRSYVSIGGRLQLDGAIGQAPKSDDNKANISFRRVRINIKGQIDKYWIWKFQYDFLKSGGAGIEDAFFGYHGKLDGIYHIALLGNQHIPFGIQTPSNDRTWMELPLASNAFRPAREIGVTDHMSQRHWNLWYGAFTGKNPGGTSSPYGGTGDFLTSADLAINVINRPGHLLRVGNSVLYQRFANGGTSYKTFPDSHNYPTDLVSTPSLLGVRSDFIYSPNIAFQYEQLSFHASYYLVNAVDTINTSASATTNIKNKASFSGWSVQAEYNLTGEVRPYSTEEAQFSTIKPLHPVTDGGWGAWQVKARLDSIDLNDREHDVNGGRETNFDIGLNWFPTSYTRAELEYIKVFKVDGGPYNGEAPSIIQSRLQFVF